MRLILVDDHPVVLAGLDRLFAAHPGTEVLARCADADEALAATRALKPDLVILDVKLASRTGLDVLRQIRHEQLAVRVVFLTAAGTPHDIKIARELGADGFIYKDLAPDAIVREVAKAAAGQRPFPDATSTRTDPLAALTPRERDVVRLVAEGMRNRAIAERLGISEGTIKIHLHNVFQKLDIESRLELMLVTRDAGLGRD